MPALPMMVFNGAKSSNGAPVCTCAACHATTVRHGPHAVTDFFRDWIEQWDEPDTDWKLEVTRPDTVLALVTTRGRGRSSGVPVEMTFAQVWRFRDGEPVQMVLYPNPERGRRAAEAEL